MLSSPPDHYFFHSSCGITSLFVSI
jgi:hypothetical protein